MLPADRARLSLILPVNSPSLIRAATEFVLYLLQTTLIEMELVPRRRAATESRGMPRLLFIAAWLELVPADSAARARAERVLRARSERIYARHGVAPVSFDLQLL